MPEVPYFSQDALDKLNRSSIALSEALKKRNEGEDENVRNPLLPTIEAILAERLEVISGSPIFYQILFIAADKGLEDTLAYIDKTCANLKEAEQEGQ